MNNLIVRSESTQDWPAIRFVNETAFEGPVEADLVDTLRVKGEVLVSLVAELNNKITGHILFSRMWIETSAGRVPAVALAPLAVSPEYQRQGIGGRLIRYGLDWLRDHGENIIIVVGHPSYYPRFGFSSGKTKLLESPFPGEAFMAIELRPGALDGIRGRVIYPDAFGI